MPENDLAEELFEAIDAIVTQRISNLPYDKTVIATIADKSASSYGCYKVTTDNNISFLAYTENTNYSVGDKVYVRIPEGDYTQQKVITSKFIPDNSARLIGNNSTEYSELKKRITSLEDNEEKILLQIKELKNMIEKM